jgi:hypothetical protein
MVRKKKKGRKGSSFPKVKLHRLSWLEWLSIVLGLWLWIYPYPYKLAFSLVLPLPIIGLVMNGLSRPSLVSLVSISRAEGEEKYDLADFIQFPGIVIFIRVLIDFEFESFYSILKVGSLAFILLLLILFATHKRIHAATPDKLIIYFSIISNIALYSYAATYGVNCVFDNSEPIAFPTKVIDKSISRGKHTTYYLKVEPWGHHHDPERISVPKDQYKETVIGQEVTVDYMSWLLGIPWYYLETASVNPVDTVVKIFPIGIRLTMPGADSTDGLINITKNGQPFRSIQSNGNEYALQLDLNANYLIRCSKNGYIPKIVEVNTHVPKERECDEFAKLYFLIELHKTATGQKTGTDQLAGKVQYDTLTENFQKTRD